MSAEQEAHTAIVCWKHLMRFRNDDSLHTHPYGEFYLCIDGVGFQLTTAGRTPMRPGDLFFFPAGEPHNGEGSPDGVSTGVVVYVPDGVFSASHYGDADALNMLGILGRLTPRTAGRVPLSAENTGTLTTTLLAMIEEARLARPAFRAAVKSLLQEALLTILRDPLMPAAAFQELAASPGRDRRLENVATYLQNHFREPVSIDQLIAMTRFGHSQFHALFKKEMGCTCTQYITRLRLEHATRLIADTDDTMTSIALDCGFPCLSHFYHVFRQRFGLSPRQMRSQARKKS